MNNGEQARLFPDAAIDDELLLVDDADAPGGDDADDVARLDGVDPALDSTAVNALDSTEDDEGR